MRVTRAHETYHLSETELIDSTQSCPICTSTVQRRAAFQIQSEPDVFLLKCEGCKGYSASRMPTTEYLESLYERYYNNKERGVTFSGDVRFAKHILRLIPRGGLDNLVRVCDFGSGDGSLGMAIAESLISENLSRNVELLLVDPSCPANLSSRSSKHIAMRRVATFAEIDGQYDLVLASAVLEHIPNLNQILQRLFAAIARGGCFYARTPFMVPLKLIIPNLDLTFPNHVHDLGSSFWNRAADTFGFEARYLYSGPSVVGTTWKTDPLRTLAAYALKLPSQIEGALSRSGRKDRIWNLVGGWEVLLQRY